MISRSFHRGQAAFTMVELLVAMGVSGIVMVAVLTTWTALQATAVNVRGYAERQSDQMRVLDYLKRDIRRATSISIYNGATVVTGTNAGSELRLTIPDYYTDAREEDNALGTKTPQTPTLTSGNVTYGTAITVRYYVLNGAIVRNEAGTVRSISDAAGAFMVSFRRTTTEEVRSTISYNQPLRSGVTRTLRRQVDLLCGRRTQLQL